MAWLQPTRRDRNLPKKELAEFKSEMAENWQDLVKSGVAKVFGQTVAVTVAKKAAPKKAAKKAPAKKTAAKKAPAKKAAAKKTPAKKTASSN